MNVRSFGPGSQCGPPTQEQINQQIFSRLNQISCVKQNACASVTSCLIVTVAGAWGEIGDQIQVIRWFDTCQTPPTSFVDVYLNVRLNEVVAGITTENTTPCESFEVVGMPCWILCTTQAEIQTALNAGLGGILVTQSITLTDDLDMTLPLWVMPCGEFVTDGFTLTIEETLVAGNYQIFNTSSTEVVFGVNSTDKILLEWFGAVGDGATNDSPAIQLAFDSSVANNVWIPVTPLNNKVYGMSATVNVPYRCAVVSNAGRTSGAEFSALAAIIMFQFPNDSGNERQIIFRGGMVIDGEGIALACIDAGNVGGTVIDGVSFRDAVVGIDQSGGGIINQYHRLRFSTTFTTCLQIGGISNFISITEGMFAATAVNAILTDATWTGGALNIVQNVFDPASAVVGIDTIKILRLNNATPTLHANIENNRFDGGTANSHINIGQYNYVNIENNGFSGNTGSGAFIDGDECTLSNNYWGNHGITFGANSRYCVCNPQKWGGFAPHFVDGGSLNIINPYDANVVLRKGTTVQRPTLLATGMFGYQYLDTTLDVDGKVIFWNGTAWVDATGTVV